MTNSNVLTEFYDTGAFVSERETPVCHQRALSKLKTKSECVHKVLWVSEMKSKGLSLVSSFSRSANVSSSSLRRMVVFKVGRQNCVLELLLRNGYVLRIWMTLYENYTKTILCWAWVSQDYITHTLE